MHAFMGLRSAGKLIRLLLVWEYRMRSEERPFPQAVSQSMLCQTARFKRFPLVQKADSRGDTEQQGNTNVHYKTKL